MLKNILLVAFGGALGSTLRYLISLIFISKKFPFSTLTVNIVGSFLIGLLIAYSLKNSVSSYWQTILVVGFCGGFTTFSAFSWDVISMLQNGRYSIAFIYVLAMLIISILFTFIGFNLIK